MLWIVIGIFLVAALGGLFMARQVFTGNKPSVAVAMLHGPLAAAGLFLVFWLWIESGASTLIGVAFGVLVLAAMGGFFLVSYHMRDLPHPKPVVIIHALVAVTGVGILAFAALT